LQSKNPALLVEKAVKGMLPKKQNWCWTFQKLLLLVQSTNNAQNQEQLT
jgi:ribosomal protein L13